MLVRFNFEPTAIV